jgi:parallel beta-helix repeat protein
MDLFQSWGPFNRSEYYNFTGPSIDCGSGILWFRVYINDEDSNYNWSKTAAENEWCTGSGTYGDPYVIENLYVNAHGEGGCVCIRNSKKYFIIKNCWFENAEWDEYGNGVYMRIVENGTIADNIILFTKTGIHTNIGIYNITISNNIIITDHSKKGGGRGIDLSSGTHNTTAINNKILNHYQGMAVSFSTYIHVDNNLVENTIWEDFEGGNPIGFQDANHSRLRGNILAGYFARGTFDVDEENCEGNVIENNIVSTDNSLIFDFDSFMESINSGTGMPKISGNSGGEIGLFSSNHNYVGYNIAIVDSLTTTQDLPLNMIILIIGILSIVVAVAAIAVVIRGKKRE